jgi:hypothetical protein
MWVEGLLISILALLSAVWVGEQDRKQLARERDAYRASLGILGLEEQAA